MSRWDPDRYLLYRTERERPFWELVARIPVAAPRRVVDLGCGPGTATAGLADHWDGAAVVGIDNSPAMIERAVPRAVAGRLSFELADLATWEPDGPVDVIVSNAALHWVPGHLSLLRRWLAQLSPGGALGFQVPANFDAPSHTLLRDLATSAHWRGRLSGATASAGIETPATYYRHLRDLGASVDVWETTYHHVLTGSDPVRDWVRSTALLPYLAALDPADAPSFEAAYATALRDAYPTGPAGETLFAFRRLFVVATLR